MTAMPIYEKGRNLDCANLRFLFPPVIGMTIRELLNIFLERILGRIRNAPADILQIS
jgi:hypothetical protein